MRIKWWWRLCAFVLAVIILISLAVQIWRSERYLSFEGTRILASGKPLDMWFSSPRHLVALVIKNFVVTVKHWDLPRKETVRESVFDFSRVGEGREIKLDYSLFPRTTDQGQRSIPYAVSLDGGFIAWAREGKVYAKNLADDIQSFEEVAVLEQNPTAIYFVRADLLAIFRRDGKVEAWDRRKKKKGLAGTWLDGRWSIWSHGPGIALSSFETRDIGRIDFDETGDHIDARYRQVPSERGTFLAINEIGSMAVGTDLGQVHWISTQETASSREDGGVSPVDSEPEKTQVEDAVIALAFYDDRNLFALLRNGRSFLISDRLLNGEGVPNSPPANLLSTSKEYLALAAGDLIEVTELTLKRKLSWSRVNIILTILLVLCAAVVVWPTKRLLTIQKVLLIATLVAGILWLCFGDPNGIYESIAIVLGAIFSLTVLAREVF